jgi:1A family penicillin-binding protein
MASSIRLRVPRVFHQLLDRVRPFVGRYPRLFAVLVAVLAVPFWTTIAYTAFFTYDVTHTLPGRQDLSALGEMAQATVLYDIHDKPVFTIFKEQRIEVPLTRISPNLVQAVVSIEDSRYYQHAGVDVWGIMRAVVMNLGHRKRLQGASTITQQLAGLSYPEQISRRSITLRRKVKEALLSALIERTYSKQEILEFYLNKVYFGDGFHGAEAAARGFFGKSAADLTVDEAALLAGLIQSPSNYAPTISMSKAIARRNIVLQAMYDNGVLDRAGLDRARRALVALHNGLHTDEEFGAYFKEQVRRELVDRFGWARVGVGGLKVYTTIDPDLQKAAEDMLEQACMKIEARKGYKHPKRADFKPQGDASHPDYLEGAMVSMEPGTGFVRVLVGGRSFKESHFNRANQARRQPGSAFKPFVFASAIETGMTPATLITHLDEPIDTVQGAWMPEDEHLTSNEMTLRTALRTSSNRAAVRLLSTVGMKQAIGYINQLNMGKMPQVPSLALGAAEVTPLALTTAYTAFANGGEIVKPIFIRRVEDTDGQVLFADATETKQVFTKTTAFLVANMLTDVINAGTASRARAAGFTLPAAGKTGTTNDYNDAWFVGFTPRLLTGVWLGFDQPQQIVSNGYGGELAVPLWADFMKLATHGDKAEWLERPEDVVAVEICRMSGKRPADGCSHVEVVNKEGEVQVRSMVFTEYFLKGTEPADTCDLHDSNFFQRLAGAFHKQGPTSVDQIGMPANAPAVPVFASEAAKGETAASAEAKAGERKDEKKDDAADDDKKKKRGFWSRFFGGEKKKDDEKPADVDGKKDDKSDKDKKDQKPPDTPRPEPQPERQPDR